MVANLKKMKWSPWPQTPSGTRKFQVTVNQMKIERFNVNVESDQGSEKIMSIEMKWKGATKPGLDRIVPLNFNRSSQRKHVSIAVTVKKDEPIIEWEDKFENDCVFPIIGGAWNATFTLLYGLKTDGKPKLAMIGKLNVNLAEIASEMEAVVVKKFPINLTVAGDHIEAVLSITFRFMEVRNSQESSGAASQTMTESISEECQTDSDDSVLFNSDDSPKKETEPDQVKRGGFFSWKRRRLSFVIGRKKVEPSLTTAAAAEQLPGTGTGTGTDDGKWELKEFTSRDNKTILTSPVFLSTFDQRSDKAAGESACTALVTIISHWLHSHPKETPTRSQFDTLIIEGSSEWRKLCSREDLISKFPDKHFDIETVLGAGLRPVGVCREKSFVGFFGAEKFDCLKGFGMSFDQIWDRISENGEKTRVYIVSWNDHFFILKAEKDVYYVIDTLGERLFEGCNQAFILRFDDSSTVHRKVGREAEEEEEDTDTEEDDDEEERKEMVCRGGRDSCKEFLKRFLAAIPLEELESEERRESVPYLALHHRLQIEFDLTLPV